MKQTKHFNKGKLMVVHRDSKGRFMSIKGIQQPMPNKGAIGAWIRKAETRSNIVFRASQIIQDVPYHSVPNRRNYLGFRLTYFHNNPNYLTVMQRQMRQLLLDLTSKFLKWDILDWNDYNCYVGTEPPTPLTDNTLGLSGTWVFRVERNGIETYSRNGNF